MMPKLLLALSFFAGFGVMAGPADAPDRGVARLSLLSGDVSIRRGDSGDLIAAALNAPLVVQDRVLTGPGSRTEIQFDYANLLRLSSSSEVRLSELEYNRYQVQIAVGTATFTVLRDSRAEVELSTPSVSVRPAKRGEYRILVREDGSSEITVRSGEAEIYTPRGSERLSSGKTMLARGPASDPEYQIVEAIGRDEWDEWNERRSHDLQRSRSYAYVSPDVYGVEDLDTYGRWVYVEPYGQVWAPSVAVGWAPYRFGRWSWIDYYGWTWVSYDPWGWAPYHYGRWFYGPGYGWCWYPGALRARAYWSPALVAFFGFGSFGGFHAGLGFGYGNIGWVPLAPYEPFYPWYGRGYYGGYRNGAIVNTTTVVNNINITNVYRNARVDNGVTAVDATQFGRAAHNGNFARVGTADLAQANLVRGQVPLTPARESLRLSDQAVRTAVLPQTREDRSFFARKPPQPVDRVPFDQQQRSVEQVARRTFMDAPGRAAGREAVAAGTVPSAAPAPQAGSAVRTAGAEPALSRPQSPPAATEAGQGWRRAAEGRQGPAGPSNSIRMLPSTVPGTFPNTAPNTTPNAADNGWRRFGNGASGGGIRQEAAPPVRQAAPETNGYRRVGEPGRVSPVMGGADSASPRQTTTPRNTPDTGGYRRFGENGPGAAPVHREGTPVPQAAPENGYRRFGEAPPQAPERRVQPQNFSESGTSWRRFADAPRGEMRSGAAVQGEAVRISPPIVRERAMPAMPRMEMQRVDIPRMEMPRAAAPRMEAPHQAAPAPARTAGGGGGGAATRGGGGEGRAAGGRGR